MTLEDENSWEGIEGEENRMIELESKACARGREDGREGGERERGETCGKCGKSARRGSRVTGRINNGGCFNNLDGRAYRDGRTAGAI